MRGCVDGCARALAIGLRLPPHRGIVRVNDVTLPCQLAGRYCLKPTDRNGNESTRCESARKRKRSGTGHRENVYSSLTRAPFRILQPPGGGRSRSGESSGTTPREGVSADFVPGVRIPISIERALRQELDVPIGRVSARDVQWSLSALPSGVGVAGPMAPSATPQVQGCCTSAGAVRGFDSSLTSS